MEYRREGQGNGNGNGNGSMASHPNNGDHLRRGLSINEVLNHQPQPHPNPHHHHPHPQHSLPQIQPPYRALAPGASLRVGQGANGDDQVQRPFGHSRHSALDLSHPTIPPFSSIAYHQPGGHLPSTSQPDFIMDHRRHFVSPTLPPINTNPQPTFNDFLSHMTHSGWVPPQIPNTYQEAGPRLPSLSLQETHRMANPATAQPTKSCMICLDAYVGDDVKTKFPHVCNRCTAGNYCVNCLKDWFLDACKNESKMPPKCCTAIPLKTMIGHLNTAQIELFTAKFEEWSTAERLYCPVPSCSAFIPPRLYVEPMRPALTPSPPNKQPKNSLGYEPGVRKAANHIPSPVATKPSISCPDCNTLICTKCRGFFHFGDCPQTDLDPTLEEQLKKWKIKRCPKCRTGVRKVFGCSHVECRCGAHFCYECLLPFTECDGQCEDDSDAEPNEAEPEEDDLDGRAGFYDGDGHEFGDEPYGSTIDTWGCNHIWNIARPTASESLLRPRHFECHRCFRSLRVLGEEKEVRTSSDGDVEMGGMPEPAWPQNIFNQPAWQCFSGHMRCTRCPKEARPHRRNDVTWMWSCDCGLECRNCDRNQAMALKEKEDEVAWECRCGMMLCQGCKKFIPDD